MRILLGLTLLFSSLISFCQDRKPFSIGLSGGGYFANKHTGFRYDGSDIEYINEGEYTNGYDVEWLLQNTSNTNSIYNQIKRKYDDLDFDVADDGYPFPVNYRPAISFGIHTGYFLNDNTEFFIDADFVKLKVEQAITFEVFDPSIQTAEQRIEIEVLTGSERRLNFDAGFHVDFGQDLKSTPFFEAALNITNVRVEESALVVQGAKYVMTAWRKNNPLLNIVDFGGTSIGGTGGVGYRYKFSDQLTADVGYKGIFNKINLGPKTSQAYKLQNLIYLRILWL